MTVEVLSPHGFCAGVTGALEKALRLAEARQPVDPPIYCLHEIVHNELVVAELKSKGFVFVESVEEIPGGATVLFSAHGVSPAVRAAAEARRLDIVDATCPFVARVHKAARAFAERGLPVVVIGKENHVEVKGIVGEVEAVGGRFVVISGVDGLDAALASFNLQPSTFNLSLGVVSQTTMNADEVARIVAALKERFAVETMAEVCQATKVRQDAVKAFRGDALLVLGSSTSSNTRRLCEVAGCRTFRAATLDEVKALDLAGVRTLGVTAGASTPESFISEVIARLKGGEAKPLLSVRDLRIAFRFEGRRSVPVRGVSFAIPPSGRIALVGESGCGKSLTALALGGLVDRAEISGTVDGAPRIAYIFQNPMQSLNPVMRVGTQLAEAMRGGEVKAKGQGQRRMFELLAAVGLTAETARKYPCQLSGGQQQRVMIAMALAAKPDLLIADEPTTALDVTTQKEVLDLIDRVADANGMAVLLITHNLGLVSEHSRFVNVMYAGEIVEAGPVAEVLARPIHPYTAGLVAAVPRLDAPQDAPLRDIPGTVPPPTDWPSGCAFHPRCPSATDACRAGVLARCRAAIRTK